MTLLLDTCALIWWALDPTKLSKRATEACQRLEADGGAISSISIWEIGVKVKKGKLDIGLTIEEFTDRLKKTDAIEIIAIDDAIWIENLKLQWAHGPCRSNNCRHCYSSRPADRYG